MESSEIKVSIQCLTYNHKDYIRDMFEGILKQKTNFKYNVFVYDDKSTDGTTEIVLEYAERYPGIIHALVPPYNTHSQGDQDEWMEQFKKKEFIGKYGCWCEGDDYWTDPNKLQMQYDFMEAHPDVSLTVHASEWLNCETGMAEVIRLYPQDGYILPEEVIMPPIGIFSFASVMAKKEVFFFDDGFPRADILDYPFQLYALTKGKIYYFDRNMSVYRYRHAGSWTSETEKSQERFLKHIITVIDFLKEYDDYTKHAYSEAIIKRGNWWLCRSAYLNSSIDSNRFFELLDIVTDSGKNEYSKYFDPIKKTYLLLSGKYEMTEYEKKKLIGYSHIVVLGLGDYQQHIAANLEYNGIEWDGFIELDHRKKESEYCDRKVWSMNEYPFDWDDTFIIIGGVWKLEKETMPEIEKYQCNHFFAPLWHDYLGIGA